MTLFIQLQDGQPVGFPIAEDNFRQLFSNTSFPAYFTADAVEPLGYGIYDFSNQPENLGRYEKAVEVAPVRNDYGIWRQTWAVVSMTDAEKQATDEAKAKAVRAERNWRLTASDWTQLDDTPLSNTDKAQWAAYRQALRDVTEQVGFPWDVIWPEPPHG
jgi:hypothetical protein